MRFGSGQGRVVVDPILGVANRPFARGVPSQCDLDPVLLLHSFEWASQEGARPG